MRPEIRLILVWLFALLCLIISAFGAPLTTFDDLQKEIDKAGPNSVIQLGPGRFNLWATLVIPNGMRFTGAGQGITTLARAGDYPYTVIQNAQSGGESIIVENLSIDCALKTFVGVCLYGSRNTVQNVHVYNHVSPLLPNGQRQEAFAILLTSANDPAGKYIPAWGNLIDNCLVSNFAGNYDGGLVIAGLGGVEGTIRNSRIRGGPKPNDPFDFTGVIGAAIVENCVIEDVAIGIYTEGMDGGLSMIVRNNTFRNIRGSAIKVSLERPQPYLVAYGNSIHLSGGTTIMTSSSPTQLEKLEYFGNTHSGTEPVCYLSGTQWKLRKQPIKERTTIGGVTLEGDWKKAFK